MRVLESTGACASFGELEVRAVLVISEELSSRAIVFG
jgi:hypothetical protein